MTSANDIDGYTRLVGLIGQPAGNGLSLAVHNAAFDALGLNWRCVLLSVPEGQLREALFGLRAAGFAGARVAAPHQRDVLPCLESLSPAAEAIQAVDLVQLDEHGRLMGDNIYWRSFLTVLRGMVPSTDALRPLVVGAGEAVRAIVYALVREGLPVTVVSPCLTRTLALVDNLRHVSGEHNLSFYRWPHDLARVATGANLIINATSPERWPDDVSFSPDAIVFDLTCQLYETLFLRQARAAGARTVDGLQLLIHEAALAFERWTGQTPPLGVLVEAVERALATERVPAILWPTDQREVSCPDRAVLHQRPGDVAPRAGLGEATAFQ